ncbi:unnamed protein product [Acanthoscelides obtectus]|uniref:PiggyBac transposable element-derived protein domain-containing protein n=1 Tax=Acanthoscelides obtectus TaxID=200917 RepID=A0A9P0Q5B1_ACAOB|nr:unnamed protein product [Acanthoscelides obtectus]CAK1642497.1 hypothetical protein AOBTE_LOCUS13067 [Acanthoscelides obtectus]
MRKNKGEIPSQFHPHKDLPALSSEFAFTREKTFVSYVPKKNRSVILLSTMHHDKSVSDTNRKPEIIEFYNSTKGGVDSLDQKCAVSSFKDEHEDGLWQYSALF